MSAEQFGEEISASVAAIFALAGPVMIIAAVIGLLIAVLQAATQIQDQTIGQIVKIFVISMILYAFGDGLAAPLIIHATHILNDFPTMVR